MYLIESKTFCFKFLNGRKIKFDLLPPPSALSRAGLAYFFAIVV